MKFRDQLNSLKVAEWSEHYLDYELVKDTIEKLWEKAKKKKKKDKNRKDKKDTKKKENSKDKKKESKAKQNDKEDEDSKEDKDRSFAARKSTPSYGSTTQSTTNRPLRSAYHYSPPLAIQVMEAGSSGSEDEKEARRIASPPSPDSHSADDADGAVDLKTIARRLPFSASHHSSTDSLGDEGCGPEFDPSELYYKDIGPDEEFFTPYARQQKMVWSEQAVTERLIAYTEMGLYLPTSVSTVERKKMVCFFDLLIAEVEKVDAFFGRVQAQLAEDVDSLKARGLELRAKKLEPNGREQEGRQHRGSPCCWGRDAHEEHTVDQEEQAIKNECYSIFRRQQQVLSFVSLNYTGFDKLVKTYDKLSGGNSRSSFRAALQNKDFLKSNKVQTMNHDTIVMFADCFNQGNTGESEYMLRKQLVQYAPSRPDSQAAGVKYGFVSALALALVYRMATMSTSLVSLLGPYEWGLQPIFQSCGLALLLLWLWGCCLWVWTQFQINYVYIFEFDPDDNLGYHIILEEAANISLVYLGSLLMLTTQDWVARSLPAALAFPAVLWPISLLLYFIIKLCLPCSRFAGSRFIVFESMMNVLKSPYGRLRFRDQFAGEMMTSINKLLLDGLYACCFYVYLVVCYICMDLDVGAWASLPYFKYKKLPYFEHLVVPLMLGVPMLSRMLQTIQTAYETRSTKQLANTFKYFLAVCVVVLGALHPLYSPHANLYDDDDVLRVRHDGTVVAPLSRPFLGVQNTTRVWLVLCVVLTIYSALWDAVYDWGLLANVRKFKTKDILRSHIMFYRPWIYYGAMLLNLVLRFSWCVSFTPFDWTSREQTHLVPLLLALEMGRRAMWAILTVEAIHVRDSQIGAKQEGKRRGGIPIFLENKTTEDGKDDIMRYSAFKEVGLYVAMLLSLVVLTKLGVKVSSLVSSKDNHGHQHAIRGRYT